MRQFAPTNARLLGFEASVTVQPVADIRAASAGGLRERAGHAAERAAAVHAAAARTAARDVSRSSASWDLIEERVAARQTRLGDGDTPTPGYAIVNVGVGDAHRPGARSCTCIRLSCDNLFDRVYRDNLSVVKDFIPQPGRRCDSATKCPTSALGPAQVEPPRDRGDDHEHDQQAPASHRDRCAPARDVEIVEAGRGLAHDGLSQEHAPTESVRLDSEIGQGARALGEVTPSRSNASTTRRSWPLPWRPQRLPWSKCWQSSARAAIVPAASKVEFRTLLFETSQSATGHSGGANE